MNNLLEQPVTDYWKGGLGESQAPVEPKKKDDQDDVSEESKSKRELVKSWCAKIKKAKEKWNNDFERMRHNMDFVAGLQCPGQDKIEWDEQVINFTMKTINNRVAALYARNPQVDAKVRERLDFAVWDEKMETIIEAVQQAQQMQMMGQPVPPELLELLHDFQTGKARQRQAERIGKTLKVVYQYFQQTQEPRFKIQMKQLVRRVAICGVGYIKILFCRDNEDELTHSETADSVSDRAKSAMRILEKLQDGKIETSSADVQTLNNLVASLNITPTDNEFSKMRERLVFDFPQATAIIPDTECRMLRGFVGARYVAEEFRLPVETVNTFFDLDIKSTDISQLDSKGQPVVSPQDTSKKDDAIPNKVLLWHVHDLDSKSDFIIADGYKDFILAPEPISPCTRGFWQIIPVLFNDVEVTEECKATIFPPSDVDLIKPVQKEWNRTREALKQHRIANRPRGMVAKGALTDEDLDKISNSQGNQIVELAGLQPGTEPGKALQPLVMTPIESSLYDTAPLREDTLLATGQQEANIGPVQANVTATVGNIAEQSRVAVVSSDVDGLDDSLTDAARCGGELILHAMSIETVKRIAGVGAVFPTENKADFINEIELEVVAASSGKPNKALELNNWQQISQILMAAQAAPQAMIRETIKRMDDRLDPADFFPLPPMPVAAPAPAPGVASKGTGNPPVDNAPQGPRHPQPVNRS